MTETTLFGTTIEIRILMSMIARLSMRDMEEQIEQADLGISGLQYGILRALQGQPFTLSELSKKFILDPSTLVPVIDALERKGFVTRGKDPTDRRRLPLNITEAGTALLNRIPLAHENDMLYVCMNELGADKAQSLLTLLREVMQHLPGGVEMLRDVTTRIQAYSCDRPASADPT
ncbi:MAG: MarR family transcriptional regulator [Chloroflexi bacterium]|uniref:MarR family winged helix-turn-helix transcriptional regulator n=1 Tax=Candidatus Flexifilum breve TaxID=3140694 RepID=UPI0031360897|nr:MarR family transcriptional regulator [Chloroflexota bacterium]